MRFMILSRADKNIETAAPDPALFEAMNAYMEEMHKAGVLLAAEGLQPLAKGAMVKFRGGKPTVTDGPFAEAKELIAGFSIIQVKSKEEAIEWVKRSPAFGIASETEIEIRQLFDADDFAEHLSPESRAREDAMRAEMAARGMK
jgi:hypothetical protein